MAVDITSRDNERVKFARRLASSSSFRAQQGLFFAEGKKLCADLAATLTARTVFYTEEAYQSWPQVEQLAPEALVVTRPVAEKLSDVKTPQGVFCLFELPGASLADMNAADGILLCETLQDPANVGTVLRSAAAFGFGGVVLANSADAFSAKALRASMGAVGRIPVVDNMEIPHAVAFLKELGVTVYAAALQEAKPLTAVQPQKPMALLIGNEGAGLREQTLALADETVYIPMKNDVESLNAAAAAAVLMYHFAGPV